MGRATLLMPLALLFLASVIPSKAQKNEAAAGEESRVTVTAGAPLTVECRLRPEQRAEWRRDGATPPPDLRAAPEAAAGSGLAARLQAPAARDHHAGLYTCSRERDHRVRVVVLPAESAAPVSVSPSASEAVPAAPAGPVSPAAAGASDLAELLYDVRGNLSLHCSLPNENSLAYVWTKNGTALEQVWEMTGRYVLEKGGAELRLARALEDDFGNYTCGVAGRSETQGWAVRGRPHLKVPANTNVVEGQRLKLVCKVIGKPYRPVSWWYSNSSDDEGNFTEVTAALGARAVVGSGEGGAPGAVLTVEAAARSPHRYLFLITVISEDAAAAAIATPSNNLMTSPRCDVTTE
nr:hemicentin-1-like [Danaus plexippus plexippus]